MRTKLIFTLFLISLWEIGDLYAQSTEIRPGIILPQMTSTQRTALSATNGMLVFDTSTQSYWLRSSGAWTELPKTAANTNFWQQTGAAGNEIKNTNSGGFWSANTTGLTYDADNTTNPPTAPVSGAGTRLMWIPTRSAFRAGTISSYAPTLWDGANIGLFSFATGFDNKASGKYSIATGLSTGASGEGSTAMGGYAEATGPYSTAMGNNTRAIGETSTAMGNSTDASGNYSTAMGYHTVASGEASTAIGRYNSNNPDAIFMVGNGSSYTARSNAFTIRADNNRVGIGTDNPIAHLDVRGYGDVQGQIFQYFGSDYFGFGHINLSPEMPTSIYADHSIISGYVVGAFQYAVSSDIRIKNIINRSDNVADLDLLKKIQITNYRMKDKATWGDKIFKKVIAQEVEKIYPEAVSKQTSVIPDIYSLAEKVNYDANKKELNISLVSNYDLKIGDKIELVHPKKGKVRTTISAVSGNTFTVKDWLYETDKIFVFGREVDDFRVIDYEALSMLGISAIQALAKENEELRMRVENLEKLFKSSLSINASNTINK